ncbi:MAG: hypothetical protein MZW92_31930 [Comamonadaceae bacterium]|nr:hypothetical protein [Comamonadaceae bacterium]
MSPTPPDPEHTGWLTGIIGLAAAIMALIGKYWNRHEKESDGHEQKTIDTMTAIGHRIGAIEVRVAVLEDRKLVTLPELRVAIIEALDEAQKLFSPQHKEIIEHFNQGIKESEKETIEMVTECNRKIREDLGMNMDVMHELVRLLNKRNRPRVR